MRAEHLHVTARTATPDEKPRLWAHRGRAVAQLRRVPVADRARDPRRRAEPQVTERPRPRRRGPRRRGATPPGSTSSPLECPDEPRLLAHRAWTDGNPAFTWEWLDRRSSQLAGALADRGLGFGDRLGIGLRNSPQFVISVFAAWKLGAVPVPVRWDLPEWELERVRAVIEPRVLPGRGRPRVDRRHERPPECPRCPTSSRRRSTASAAVARRARRK